MIKVNASAPTRIDLAGGTLDLWPIHHLLERKATVNVAVTLNAQVELTESSDGRFHFVSQDQGVSFSGSFDEATNCRELPLIGLLVKAFWRRELPPLTITSSAKSPVGAGLGGSSCLGITIAGALWRALNQAGLGSQMDERVLVQTVQDVEARLIHAPTGCQDYWGALRGGINVITFPFGGTHVETIPPHGLAGLEDELVLCYSGRSRASAINNWEIYKRLFDGDQDLLSIFNNIGSAAEECAQAVRDGDLAQALFVSQREWRLRTSLWPHIETPETTRLDTAAKEKGARFSRVCGAGGGGVMAIFAPRDKRSAVEAALVEAGGIVLPATVAHTGLSVS